LTLVNVPKTAHPAVPEVAVAVEQAPAPYPTSQAQLVDTELDTIGQYQTVVAENVVDVAFGASTEKAVAVIDTVPVHKTHSVTVSLTLL
jgi:hypothetical protein